jgi:hypothetical protein
MKEPLAAMIGDRLHIKLKSLVSNSGPVTFNRRVLTLVNEDNRPLMAGELKVGSIVEFNPFTGHVIKIIDPDESSRPRKK